MEPITVGLAMLIGAGVSAAFKIGGDIIGEAGKDAEKKRQAQIIQDRAREIGDLLNQGKIDEQDALNRLNTMKNSLEPKMRSAFEAQLNVAADEMTSGFKRGLDDLSKRLDDMKGTLSDQREIQRQAYQKAIDKYKDSVDKQNKGVKQAFQAERMGVSGAFTDAMKKSQEETGKHLGDMAGVEGQLEQAFYTQLGNMQKDYSYNVNQMTGRHEEGISNMRLKGGAQLTQMMGQLEQDSFNNSERLRQGFRQERMGLQGAQMDLRTQKEMLNQPSFGLDFLGRQVGTFGEFAGDVTKAGLAGGFGKPGGAPTGPQQTTADTSFYQQQGQPQGNFKLNEKGEWAFGG